MLVLSDNTWIYDRVEPAIGRGRGWRSETVGESVTEEASRGKRSAARAYCADRMKRGVDGRKCK